MRLFFFQTRRRVFGLLAGVFLLPLGYVIAISGWLDGPHTWEEATGYENIQIRDRPLIQSQIEIDRGNHSPAETLDDENETLESESSIPNLFWLGHSGFLLEWHGTRILLDPNLDQRCTIMKRLFRAPVKPEDLPPIDAILISHSHFDHMDAYTLNGIKSIGKMVVPLGSKDYLPDLNTPVHELELQGSVCFGPIKVTGVKAKHNGGRLHPLKSSSLALGYILSDGETTLYFAGDTGFGDHFREIGRTFHPDVAILPIGAYSPAFPLRYYHLNPPEALEAAKILGVRLVIPCHFGTFRLSLDHPASALPWFSRLNKGSMSWQMAPLYRSH